MTSPAADRIPLAAGWTIVQVTGPDCPSCLGPWCAQVGRLLARGRVLVCDLHPRAAADLTAVDALARLVLAAQRAGAELRVRTAGTDLGLFWEWIGLGDLRPPAPGHDSGREGGSRLPDAS
ncbi:MAG TPA: hypothetical protein VE343_07785 [Streptosporangiaceae bacterium]|nr:hypothetical protein [Streptosporangiaceae bacterium]